MSLRSKIVLILAAVAVLYVGLDVLMLNVMVSRQFVTLEEEEATTDLERVVAGIGAVEANLAGLSRRWAEWDDTSRFVIDRNRSFQDSNLGPRALERNGIHMLYILDEENRVVWGRIEEPGTRESIRLKEFPAGGLSNEHPVLGAEMAKHGSNSGLFVTERGAMLVAAQVILNSEGEGRPRGKVILGRFFDRDLRDDLRDRVKADVAIWPLEDPTMPARVRELLDAITTSPIPITDYEEEGFLDIYSTVLDVRGLPEMILRATIDRSITAGGHRIFNAYLLSTLATALLILLVLLHLLQKIVLRPIAQLTVHAVEIGKTDDTSLKVGMKRDDEIGQLSDEFDRMLGKLEKSRAEVVKTARMAGMSEIATGVLHNVGNVLNSVNVSANLLTRKLEQMALTDLRAMTEVLQRNSHQLGKFVTEDEQGKQFLPFLDVLSRGLEEERGAILSELKSLGRGVEHIMDLVRNQQSYAGKAGVIEHASLSEQVDIALSMCQRAHGGPLDIEVVRDFEELPRVRIDKHRLMEILVNLIQNARQSLAESGSDPMRLTLRVKRGAGSNVDIEIEDNGIGIAEENLTRIFGHGFTTREEGHGFGLHISANAATEMKSSLKAFSEGKGEGARFVLSLAVDIKEAMAA
ncbi:MAG: ATP-binding protein [Planctomycetota bacterium]|nr:ATP-binding protein [Planctomycetota bacterium]